MREREGRSCAPPPPAAPPRQRWERPDVPRPAAPVRIILPSPDATVPDLDPPEPLTRLDHLAMLPQGARRDLVAGFDRVTL